MSAWRSSWLAATLCLACGDPLYEPEESSTEGETVPAVQPVAGWPELRTPCSVDPPPRGLLLTTTDFSTGALTHVDIETREVTPDVALGTPDGVPFWHGERAYVVHRFQYDFVDVLQPEPSWVSQGQHDLADADDRAPNPQSIAFGPDGLAYVPLFGPARVDVLDLSQAPGQSRVGAIDLSPLADDDGSPEASLSVMCGDTLFVSVQRLATQKGFVPVDHDILAAIDPISGAVYDREPEREGVQGIELQGVWLKQLRRDPTDASGLTLWGLTTGIERLDLRAGTSTWLLPPETFEAVSIRHYQLPIAFDVTDDGRVVVVAAYGPPPGEDVDCTSDPGPCFTQARLFYAELDAPSPTLIPFADDFDAVERSLEIVGDELWFGSRRAHAPGLFVFDLQTLPPTQLAGPLSTGLPPYALTVIGARP